jgi:hypothetical protein
MKRLLLGMLLASLSPVLLASLSPVLLAQTIDQRPPKDDSFGQGSGTSRVIIMPPPDSSAAPAPPDDTGPPAPTPNIQEGPAQSDDTVTAMPPPSSPAEQVPQDNAIIMTPLPPPPPVDQTDSSQQNVPNPLDNPDAAPVAGASKQTQTQGQPVPGGWVKMGSATLQALDKVNAVEKTLVVKVGDSGRFDSLDIAVRGCFVRPPDRPADATAFLVIRDQRSDTPAFNGWMDRAAPYMSMMAHPLYDVRVTGCTP